MSVQPFRSTCGHRIARSEAAAETTDGVSQACGLITQELARWSSGDIEGFRSAYSLAYPSLLRAATRCLARERTNHTLDPNSLVAEVFFRLRERDDLSGLDRRQFISCASWMMRQVLVDHGRKRMAKRRAPGAMTLCMDEDCVASPSEPPDILALDDAISQLHAHSPEHAQMLVLSYFGGLTQIELAAHFQYSVATIERRMAFAKAWLRDEMSVRRAAPVPLLAARKSS